MSFRRKGCFSSHQTNRLAKPWTLLGGLTLKNVASWTSRLPAREHVVQLPIICDRKVSTPETLWHHHIPQGHFPAMSTDISRAMDSLQFPTPCSRTPFEMLLKRVMNYLPSLPILAILQILCPYFWSKNPDASTIVHSSLPCSGEWHALKCYRFTTQDGHGTEANRQWAVRYRVSPDQKALRFSTQKMPWNFEIVLLLKL